MTKYRRFDTGEDDYYILPDGELISVKDYDGYLGDMYEDWREEDDPEDGEPENSKVNGDSEATEDSEPKPAEEATEDTDPAAPENSDPELAEDSAKNNDPAAPAGNG